MNLLDKIKKDLEKELKASIAFIKEGTAVLRKKSREVSREEEKRYKINELKTKVQEEMAGLGGRMYELSLNNKNPQEDKRVTAFLKRIKSLDTQISRLEKQPRASAKGVSKKRSLKRKSK